MKVFDAEVSAEFAIYAVCLPRRLNDPLISGTMDWLVREAQSSPDAHRRRRPEPGHSERAIS